MNYRCELKSNWLRLCREERLNRNDRYDQKRIRAAIAEQEKRGRRTNFTRHKNVTPLLYYCANASGCLAKLTACAHRLSMGGFCEKRKGQR